MHPLDKPTQEALKGGTGYGLPRLRRWHLAAAVIGVLGTFLFVAALSLRSALRSGWNCLPVLVRAETPEGSPVLKISQVLAVSPWGSTTELMPKEGAWLLPREERRGISEFVVVVDASQGDQDYKCKVSLEEHSLLGDGKGLCKDITVTTNRLDSSTDTHRYSVKLAAELKSLLPGCGKYLNWGGDARISAYAFLWASLLVGLPFLGLCLIWKRSIIGQSYTKHRKPVWFTLAVLSFALPYCDIPYGLDFTDSPYHLVESHRFVDHPMTVLSYYLISKWQALTGGAMLFNRIAVMLALQAIGSLLIFVGCGKNHSHLPLSVAALNLLLSMYDGVSSLSYDSVSTFFLIATFCALYAWSAKKFCLIYLILASVASSLAVACRFPNVVLIPIVISWFMSLVATESLSKWSALKQLTIFLSFFLGALVLIYSCFYESFADAASRLHVGQTHTVFKLLRSYCRDIPQSISWAGVLIAGACGWNFVGQTLSSTLRTKILLSFLFCVVIVALLMAANSWYNFSLSSLLVAVFAIQVLYIGFSRWQDGCFSSPETCFLGFTGMFLFVPTAGSDTGLLKAAVIPLIPFLAALHWHRYAPQLQWMLTCAAAALLLYLPIQRLGAQYEDSGRLQSHALINHPALWGIRTTNQRKAYVEDILSKVASSNESYAFFGRARYIFSYLLGQGVPLLEYFSGTLEKESFIKDSRAYLESQQIKRVFVVPDYPQETSDGPTKFEKMLLLIGYSLETSGADYRVYRLSPKMSSASIRPPNPLATTSPTLPTPRVGSNYLKIAATPHGMISAPRKLNLLSGGSSPLGEN